MGTTEGVRMRRRVWTIAAAAVVALAAPSAAAASHGNQTGGRDFVAGSAQNLLFEVPSLPADLRLDANGFDTELPLPLFGATDLNGHAVGSGELPNGRFLVAGEVTCLKVVGNRATVKFRFQSADGDAGARFAAWGVQVFVEDNGDPSGGIPDANSTDAPLPPELFEPQANQCELPRGPFNPIDAGNYVVHDADAQ
jgi:hypothetical protein